MFDPDLFIDAEKNSTFDLEALEKSLADIKQTSFKYLYELQKNAVNYKRFDLKMSDLKLDKNTSRNRSNVTFPKRYIAHISENFISERKRLAYKRSVYYNKELSVFQTANDTSVFTDVFLVFVDGKYYDTINIRCKEDVTEVIFDIQEKTNPTGLPESHFNSLRQTNANITVFFMPNTVYGAYTTNYNVLNMYKNQLALKNLNISGNLSNLAQYITFINTNDLLFTSVITDTANSTDMLKFYDNNLRSFDSKYVHLNVFGFRNLLDQYNIPGNNTYFSIPLQEMPVPVENLMVFTNDADGNKTFAHNITIKLHYPNMYEIIGNTSNANLTIYAFYFKDNINQGLKFNNELDVYQKLFGNDIGRYMNNLTPDIVKSYDPTKLVYDTNDFIASSEYSDHLEYKIDKLKMWISQNPNVLRTYLNNQMKTSSGYIIDVSQINLSPKIRTNNWAEVDYENEKLTFSEQRYLFILSNESTDLYSDVRFYIDGILYVPDITYKDSSYEYYYIPVSLIKSNSLIEVERFNEVEYQKVITVHSPLDKVELTPRTDWVFNPTDVYVVDPNINKFVNRSAFKVIINRNGLDVELDSSSMKSLSGSVSIRIVDPTLMAKSLYVFIRRHIYFETKDIKEADDIGTVFYFQSRTNYDLRNVRVFKNGRFLPSSLYDVDFETKVNGKNFVTPLIRKQIGDKFVVDCTPYKYKTVLELNYVNPTGLVNLRGIVDKPFDLKWYDIYLNGRRLNKNQVEIVSPTLIFISNVSSLKNLVILEKDRDTEYFALGVSTTLQDALWDSDTEFKTTLTNRPTISDSETDIITELEDAIEFEKMRMFLLVIGADKIINPDNFQIDLEEQARFPHIFTGSQDFYFIDPDENLEAISRMKIFPV
jgi:hypothetical protein